VWSKPRIVRRKVNGMSAAQHTAGHEHSHSGAHDPAHGDAWHHHDASEGLPQAEHIAGINSGLIATWFIGIMIAVVVLVALVSVYFDSVATRMRAERVETTVSSKAAVDARAEADKVLGNNAPFSGYTWTDPAKGTLQMPLEFGQQKVIEKYSQPAK
jgi:hypothetical protein